MSESENKGSIVSTIAAIAGNILVGVVKFIASAISGSSAMFSEGIHSIVDSGNGLLVLLGIHRSQKKPDATHPFGYGKELYFWTMVVSVMIFALGGGFSIYEGIHAIGEVGPDTVMGDPLVSYIVLLAAAVIEGASLTVALKNFNAARGDMGIFEFIRKAKDPSLFTVVFEDSAAELGILIALCGIFFGHLLHNPYLDGVASVLIGVLLCTVAIILLHETRSLLIGEGLQIGEIAEVERIVLANEHVEECGQILSLYLGPHDLLITADVTFTPGTTRNQINAAVDEIERSLVERFPETTRVFIEPETLEFTSEEGINSGADMTDEHDARAFVPRV